MEVILFAIPFIVAIFLLIFRRHNMVWWEYALVVIPTIILVIVVRSTIIAVKTTDTEYYGGYITKVRHYDEWDEWIERRCTRQVEVGKDSEGNAIYEEESYDCSYRQYHSQYWVYFSNISGGEHHISEQQFNDIKRRFNSPKIFVDMHRDYYTIDGDAQDYMWPNTRNTIRTITEKHEYKNKVKASNSIFNFS